ncbi:MAG: copper amine oxidase N-terminal domain-containing protein [Lachnospiraceae bacterium]|nr:copper amine oxidase N-terminal domain-containing protein [Lachnospiraceae bacterium]
MKKKLALLLAVVMVLGLIPATAFATTSNRVTKVVTLAKDAYSAGDSVLVIKNDKDDITDETSVTFELTISGGEFASSSATTDAAYEALLEAAGANVITNTTALTSIAVTRTSSTSLTLTLGVTGGFSDDDEIKIPMVIKGTTVGDVKVTIDPVQTAISGGTYTVAVVNEGATVSAIEKKTDLSSDVSTAIKSITITETTAGTLKDGETLKFKLSNGFLFDLASINDAISSYGVVAAAFDNTASNTASDTSTLYFDVTSSEDEISKIVFSGIKIIADEDDCTAGDIATITISGAGTTKQSLEVGTYVEYGVSLAAADKDLPILYIGSATDDDNETLKVTFKESVANSWWSNRKTTFEFPDGIDIKAVEFTKNENVTPVTVDTYLADEDEETSSNGVTIKNNKMTLSSQTVADGKKAKLEMIFTLSLAANIEEQDIVLTVSGNGVSDDLTATVAKAEMPFTIETTPNEVNIDYRYVAINDIVISEKYAGAFDKSKTLTLAAENMQFESGFTYEKVSGDLKIDEVKRSSGNLNITISSESGKEPGVIKVSGLSLYLDRTLPAGDYKLSLQGNAFVKNNSAVLGAGETEFDGWAHDVNSRTIIKNFVTVVTAGRDQDDSTFTTKITVTIGAETMMAGSQTIALDVPAYIKGGYTMLPVRAVTEAISTAAIVRWDDPTKTVTISFGSRIIVMTIGSKTMTINGTPVAMSGICEIKDARAFLPLRDLGYALGLGDSKINWDETTSTATLN